MARRRRRARVNWAVRWGGAAWCALILVVSFATLPWAFHFGRTKGPDGWTVAIWRGQVIVIVSDFDPARANLPADMSPPPETLPRKWRFGVDGYRGSGPPEGFPSPLAYRTRRTPNIFGWTFEGFFPLWPVFVVSLVSSAIAWIPRRRHLTVRPCPSCRYSLSGLPPGSPCPECGAAPE